jgi:hypothetical protein
LSNHCPSEKKGVKFTWTSKREERFQELKHLLTHAPVLEIVDPDNDFLVCTDACKEGLREVLMQEGCVICYESIKLSEHEINYVTHDLELDAIVHALKMWRHYLMGRRFLLMKDQCGLRHLFDQPKLNARQARWMVDACSSMLMYWSFRGLVITSTTCSSMLMYWSFRARLCTMSRMK